MARKAREYLPGAPNPPVTSSSVPRSAYSAPNTSYSAPSEPPLTSSSSNASANTAACLRAACEGAAATTHAAKHSSGAAAEAEIRQMASVGSDGYAARPSQEASGVAEGSRSSTPTVAKQDAVSNTRVRFA